MGGKRIYKIERQRTCPLCGFTCKNNISMRLHAKQVHKTTCNNNQIENYLICSVCKKQFCVHGNFLKI